MKDYILPQGWRCIKLKQIADVIAGVSFKPDDVTQKGIRILRSGNIQNGYIEPKSDDVYLNDSYYNIDNTVRYLDNCITSSTGSIEVLGKCGTIFEKMENTQIGAFLRIVRSRSKEDALYLSLILHTPYYYQYIRQFAKNGTSINNIKNEHLENFEFPFPADIEKERISKLYYDIEKKIVLNTRMNAELEAMAKQLYDYWFVQFDFPDENGNPYKSSGGKMVYNSTLKREIPAGWNASNICIVSQILSGGTPSKAVKQYWENGNIPFFGPTDYEGSVFQMRTADHITERGLNNCASSLFEEGDIIITARGSIGKLVIVGVPMAMNQSCYALRPKNNQYEYLFFLTKQLIEYLKIKGNGSVFKSIIASDIEDSIMCIATDNVIYAYCEKVSPLFLLMKKNTEEIINLTHLRDSLLPMLMNGQVTVE